MLDLEIIIERQEEIERYIQNDDLDMATRRSMDFVSDFSVDKLKKREATSIRATYSALRKEYRQFGRTKDIDISFKKLVIHILDFIDEISEEYESKNTTEDVESFDSAKVIESNDKVQNLTRLEKIKEKFISNNKKKNRTLPLLDNSIAKRANIVFRAREVTKTYKNNSIDFNFLPLDLDLKYGEITALVGENGNGKSTLLNIIAGELLQSSGMTDYPELDSKGKVDWYYRKTQIAYIEQDLPKWKGYLRDNLHFTTGINGTKGQDNIDEVNFIIHRLGLEKYSHAKWNEISGGFKMRFSLARAILRRPKLLVLDEPLANLDINTRNLFLTDLRDMVNSLKHRMSVVVSSQNLYEIEAIADNIIFLSDGKALYNGTTKDFGKDREENSYEMHIDISQEDLLNLLTSIAYINTRKDGQNYIINTRLSVTENELLEMFLTKGVQVKYFRDISKSTRKLFGEIR